MCSCACCHIVFLSMELGVVHEHVPSSSMGIEEDHMRKVGSTVCMRGVKK